MRIVVTFLLATFVLCQSSCSQLSGTDRPHGSHDHDGVPVGESGAHDQRPHAAHAHGVSSAQNGAEHRRDPDGQDAGHGHGEPAEPAAGAHSDRPHGKHAANAHGDRGDPATSAGNRQSSHSHHNHKTRSGGRKGHGHGGNSHAIDGKQGPAGVAIGAKVPDFEVTLNGKRRKLSQLQRDPAITKDGALVLTFWCSFCHSCRHVEPRLAKLAKQYAGKAGVLALDASAGETAEEIAGFLKKKGLNFPVALNAKGDVADLFGVRATTTTVIIDKQGVLRYRGQFADRSHAFAEDALKAVLSGGKVRVKKTRQKG